jgi:hypothetical protein
MVIKVQRSVLFEKEILNKIQEMADKQNRSFSSMTNIILRELFEKIALKQEKKK